VYWRRFAGRLDFGILLLGLVNAFLYASLLPLWEGFDEPFHYGYVQWLAWERRLPVLGNTPVSRELWRSVELAPASRVVRENIPIVTTYEDFAQWDQPRRRARLADLAAIPPQWAGEAHPGSTNYEAQQAPLAYLLLSPIEGTFRGQPLPTRVLVLRLAAAVLACLLQFQFTRMLADALGLAGLARSAALFLVFANPMFYAATAHVANDWLAVPLATLLMARLAQFWQNPQPASGAHLGLAAGLGLLTKAYFVAWAGLLLLVAGWILLRRPARWQASAAVLAAMAVAAPWYARNVALYGSVLGLQQTASGVTLTSVAAEAWRAPWAADALGLLRGAIWTGNSSFNSFSARTVDGILLLLAASLVVWAWRSHGAREWVIAFACLTFLAAIAYHNAQTRAHTGSAGFSAMPWYFQTLAAGTACLVAAGLQRSRLAARTLAPALLLLTTYLLAATWWLKFIPMYAGYGEVRIRLGELAAWYAHGQTAQRLHELALGNGWLCLTLAAASPLLAIACAAPLAAALGPPRGKPPYMQADSDPTS
jgi:hypothetical protein